MGTGAWAACRQRYKQQQVLANPPSARIRCGRGAPRMPRRCPERAALHPQLHRPRRWGTARAAARAARGRRPWARRRPPPLPCRPWPAPCLSPSLQQRTSTVFSMGDATFIRLGTGTCGEPTAPRRQQRWRHQVEATWDATGCNPSVRRTCWALKPDLRASVERAL